MRELLGRYRRWRLENRTVLDAALMDVALAVALALIAQYELWFTPLMVGPRAVHFVALLFMTLPLAWRQRAPFAVIAIVNVGAATQGLLATASHDIASLLALLVAVYSVARHGDRRVAFLGAGATIVGLALYESRTFSPLGFAFASLLSLTAWVIGRVVRTYQEQTQALAQALEQQTATSDVLRIISSSPTDLRPVFEAMLANARRLCEADIAALFLYDGEVLRCAVHHNATPEFAAHLERRAAQQGHALATRGARATGRERYGHAHRRGLLAHHGAPAGEPFAVPLRRAQVPAERVVSAP